MRTIVRSLVILSSLAGLQAEEEASLPARAWFSPAELLCARLTEAIEERPDQMIMRLEDALVIDEAGAAEIVTAAMNAVQARPHLVSQIVATALKVAPAREASIRQAVVDYQPLQVRVAMATSPAGNDLDKRTEAPIGMEVRRAELPGSLGSQPIEEVRRASFRDVGNIELPAEEIRRPGLPPRAHVQ